MTHFLSSILSRHVNTHEKIMPRLPGSFEPVKSFPDKEPDEFTVPDERLFSPISKREIPEPDFSGIRETKNEIPVENGQLKQHSHESIEQKIPNVRMNFDNPVNMKPELNVLNVNEEAESKDLNLNLQVAAAPNKLFKNAEFDGGSSFNETKFEHIKVTENKHLTRLQKIESIAIQSFANLNEQVQNENAPANLLEFRLATQETKGALGEPPGRINSFKMQENKDVSDIRPETKVAPAIKVSIGQIHVHAVNPQPAINYQKPQQAHKPLLTLEDYLKGRD